MYDQLEQYLSENSILYELQSALGTVSLLTPVLFTLLILFVFRWTKEILLA